jgi:hypothetical protein
LQPVSALFDQQIGSPSSSRLKGQLVKALLGDQLVKVLLPVEELTHISSCSNDRQGIISTNWSKYYFDQLVKALFRPTGQSTISTSLPKHHFDQLVKALF